MLNPRRASSQSPSASQSQTTSAEGVTDTLCGPCMHQVVTFSASRSGARGGRCMRNFRDFFAKSKSYIYRAYMLYGTCARLCANATSCSAVAIFKIVPELITAAILCPVTSTSGPSQQRHARPLATRQTHGQRLQRGVQLQSDGRIPERALVNDPCPPESALGRNPGNADADLSTASEPKTSKSGLRVLTA